MATVTSTWPWRPSASGVSEKSIAAVHCSKAPETGLPNCVTVRPSVPDCTCQPVSTSASWATCAAWLVRVKTPSPAPTPSAAIQTVSAAVNGITVLRGAGCPAATLRPGSIRRRVSSRSHRWCLSAPST